MLHTLPYKRECNLSLCSPPSPSHAQPLPPTHTHPDKRRAERLTINKLLTNLHQMLNRQVIRTSYSKFEFVCRLKYGKYTILKPSFYFPAIPPTFMVATKMASSQSCPQIKTWMMTNGTMWHSLDTDENLPSVSTRSLHSTYTRESMKSSTWMTSFTSVEWRSKVTTPYALQGLKISVDVLEM